MSEAVEIREPTRLKSRRDLLSDKIAGKDGKSVLAEFSILTIRDPRTENGIHVRDTAVTLIIIVR